AGSKSSSAETCRNSSISIIKSGTGAFPVKVSERDKERAKEADILWQKIQCVAWKWMTKRPRVLQCIETRPITFAPRRVSEPSKRILRNIAIDKIFFGGLDTAS